MKIQNRAVTVFDRVIDILAVFAAVLIIFLMLSVTAEVVMRYIFRQPIRWIIEISEYCLLLITFFAATWVLRKEGHVTIDILLENLAPRTRALVELTTSAVCAIASLILAGYGIRVTWDYFSINYRFSTPLMPPAYPILAIIPLTYLLLFIQFIRRSRRFLGTSSREAESAPEIKRET